jgi:glucose-1-phosphate thymidylyltransferase
MTGVEEILIIGSPRDIPMYQMLLEAKKIPGISITYLYQKEANGIPEAFLLGKKFLKRSSCCLLLGDNFFHGTGLQHALLPFQSSQIGSHIFTKKVSDPASYGILEIDSDGKPLSVIEKPKYPLTNLAITGLYFFDETVVERAEKLTPSDRGELEIVDILNSYLKEGQLKVSHLPETLFWRDIGNFDNLLEASLYIQKHRHSFQIAS